MKSRNPRIFFLEKLEVFIIFCYNLPNIKKLVKIFLAKGFLVVNEEKYNSVNGVIYKLDTFKGKKALVGDYSVASYYNTRMVLDSLGIEYEIVGTIEDIKNKVLQNNYDIIFTNNIYRSGDSQKLLEELKSIKNLLAIKSKI